MQFKAFFQKARTVNHAERGQGLVEYAMILVLVALAMVVIGGIFGTSIGNVLARVTNTLSGAANASLSVTANRSGHGRGNDVEVQVTVSKSTSVTLVLVRTGASRTMTCSGVCTHTFTGVGEHGGSVQVTGGGVTVSASYPEKD